MLTAERSWLVRKDPPADIVAELEHDLRVSRLVARLMALRGVDSRTQAERWTRKHLADLHRPHSMLGMEAAAARFARAISERQRILIHGDYDVDGTTSASLLRLFARACSHDATVWIPHRRIDGYGLSEASLAAAREHRAQLMITVDCGIADGGFAAQIEAETGCDVIITDHHLPQATLPRCTAVLDPNQPGCPYPDKGLAGVGVAWKLAWATATVLSGGDKVTERLRTFLLDALALVAVGTVSDCAPLSGENRILVHHGLLALARTENPGLRALLTQARMGDDAIVAGDVGWKLSPLLNAAGRVGSAMANIDLLTATDSAAADAALQGIVGENEERKRLTQLLTQELISRVECDTALAGRSTLVFAGEGWHAGVVGIVASRLVERFGRPSAVIAINDGIGKGSLRTVAQIHLGEAISACKEHLIKGGGHAMAAGISVAADRVVGFATAFERWVAHRVPASDLAPRTQYDAIATMAELDSDFFQSITQMGPFGTGNAEPILRVNRASFVSKPRLFGKEAEHLRGAVTDAGGGMRELLAWRAKDHAATFAGAGMRFDLLVRPQIAYWRGTASHQLIYVDGCSA